MIETYYAIGFWLFSLLVAFAAGYTKGEKKTLKRINKGLNR